MSDSLVRISAYFILLLFIIAMKFKKFESGLEAEKISCPQEEHVCLWRFILQDKYNIFKTMFQKNV
jgi:hypothetical protein